jgi:hypothetical protein
MTEQELKLEARLSALEYMISHTLSRIHVLTGATNEQLDAMEDDARITLSATTLPGADPAMADMFAGELQECIERLIEITREMTDETRSKIDAWQKTNGPS